MDTPLNLTTASRAELLAIIARQQAVIPQQQAIIAQQQTVITQLQQRVTALEDQLRKKGGGTGMPGTKPADVNLNVNGRGLEELQPKVLPSAD